MGNLCCRERSVRTKRPLDKASDHSGHEGEFGYVSSLPSASEESTVDHVYDGDTLTVVRSSGERVRVRLLGIDAPELKEKEAFAQESASYLKELCPMGSTVWLLTEDGNEVDRYGRLLAHVYVANPQKGPGYYCANTCMLQEGLAFFYSPKDARLSNRQMLLSAQCEAMERRKNLWGCVKLENEVYCTRYGIAFHDTSCEHVQRSNVSSLSAAEAFAKGLSPCRTCHPV